MRRQGVGICHQALSNCQRKGTKVQLRVHPTMLHNDHPLASVKGSFNAIYMHGSAVGEVMFYGRAQATCPRLPPSSQTLFVRHMLTAIST
ncbi:MAG: hypothetical protein ACLVKR_01680 [Lachnospiraceae bacterium]